MVSAPSDRFDPSSLPPISQTQVGGHGDTDARKAGGGARLLAPPAKPQHEVEPGSGGQDGTPWPCSQQGAEGRCRAEGTGRVPGLRFGKGYLIGSGSENDRT